MKVLFIVKKRIDYGTGQGYGTAYGLGNSANFVSNFLNNHKIESKVVIANDGNEIDRLVTEFNPTHVFIEAIWVTPEKFLELLQIPRHQRRKWVVRLHSRISFIAHEGVAFPWLLRYRNEVATKHRNFFIAPNTREFTNDLIETFKTRAVYLPNVYEPGVALPVYEYPTLFKLPKIFKHPDFLDVGCFGAIRPFKNQLAQGVAAAKFADSIGRKLRFHINVTRTEQAGDQVVKNLRAFFAGTHHALVEHRWMQHDDFVHVVKQMDMGCQVSFTETFNIVAADFSHYDIPLIVSEQVKWMPWWTKVRDANSTNQICKAMKLAWNMRRFKLHYVNKWFLNIHNSKARSEWMRFLQCNH